MSKKFTYSRLFGDNISDKARAKLHARQELQRDSKFGEEIQKHFSGYKHPKEGSEDNSFWSYVNNMNYKGLGDLSSRVPWVRMWTAVQLYSVQPVEDVKNQTGKEGLEALREMAKYPDNMESWFDLYTHSYDNIKIYSIGNNVFQDYQQGSTYTNSIVNSTEYDASYSDIGNEADINSIIGRQGTYNPYMLPMSGITSVSYSSAGYMGSIYETTIQFKVFNYHDFHKIFVPYFMVPGARVNIDFGWDTADIYDPVDIFEASGDLLDDKSGGLKDTSKASGVTPSSMRDFL